MKSPGVIYRYYRQLKKKYLYERIQEARKKYFQNCIYGRPVIYKDDHGYDRTVRLCVFAMCRSKAWDDTVPNAYDICTCSRECNAFAQKWSKERVIDQFNKELDNQLVKRNRYPDLLLLEWILDKELTDAEKTPNFMGIILVYLIKCLETALKYVCRPKQILSKIN